MTMMMTMMMKKKKKKKKTIMLWAVNCLLISIEKLICIMFSKIASISFIQEN